jgi:hypothetical protein
MASVATVYSAARGANFTVPQSIIMTAISGAESTYREAVTHPNPNGSIDYGLWQINSANRGIVGDAFYQNNAWQDPLTNARAAKKVFDSQGYGAWTVYKSNAYAKFLPEAQQASTQPTVVLTGSTTQPPTDQPAAVGETFPDDAGNTWTMGADGNWTTVKANGEGYILSPDGHVTVTKKDPITGVITVVNGYTAIEVGQSPIAQALVSMLGGGIMLNAWNAAQNKWANGPGKGNTPGESATPSIFEGLSKALWIGGGIVAVLLGVVLLAKDNSVVKMAVSGVTKGLVKV